MASLEIDKIFKPRRGTKSVMESDGTILSKGELFFEYPETGVGTGTCRVKMGDGSTAYSSLPYAINLDDIDTSGSGDVSTSAITFTEVESGDIDNIVSGATTSTIIANIKAILNELNTSYTTLSDAVDAIDTSKFVSVATAGTTVGGLAKPIYVNSAGVATECSVTDNTSATALTINATIPTTRAVYYGLPYINGEHTYTASTSIYAPTSAGTSGYLLASTGSGAPTWVDSSGFTGGSTSTETVGSVTVPVYMNVGTATTCTVTDNSSATALTSTSALITERAVYYGLPTINGSHSYTSSTSIYAPTSAGTSGYVLTSSGGVPTWVNPNTLTVNQASTLGSSTVGSGTNPIYLDSGTATASTSTVGSGTKPVYLSSGTITASGSTVGSGTKPVYMSSGTVTASSSTVGTGINPVYMSSGTVTASTENLGSEIRPMYMVDGEMTECLGVVGTGVRPIYYSDGFMAGNIEFMLGTASVKYYSSTGELVSQYEGAWYNSSTPLPSVITMELDDIVTSTSTQSYLVVIRHNSYASNDHKFECYSDGDSNMLYDSSSCTVTFSSDNIYIDTNVLSVGESITVYVYDSAESMTVNQDKTYVSGFKYIE